MTRPSLLTFALVSVLASQGIADTTAVPNQVPSVVFPLPLSTVRLTGGPLKHAQELDAKYLLELEPDRMLAYYRVRAGLAPKAKGYDGWDGDGKNLTGHIAGHYLSAVSLMYAATGDVRFRDRADYIVQELAEVQKKNGNGYLGALEGGQEKFDEVSQGDIRSGGFDLNGLWSPWYVLHKTFAGLRDAYRFTGNTTALRAEIKFANWAKIICDPLTDEQMQKMLGTGFGGMDEVLADLYADTGDHRWLDLSYRFVHHAVIDPLVARKDQLGGLHANTQVPKAIGSLARYVYTGDVADGQAARFFWDTVVRNHTFATGGHGKDEYFGPARELSDRTDGRTDENCNVYNMLKMTRTLFSLQPSIKYAEYEERALFNHVLGSMDPKDGRTCYMVPVGRGVEREYQDMMHSFTCCVGSGMESHALHGDGIYYASRDRFWINFYTPSTASWEALRARFQVSTSFPEGESASIKVILVKPKTFTLALRRPSWAGEGFTVKINGQPVKALSKPGSYLELKRLWKSNDIVSLVLPKKLHTESLPDNPNRVALMWGPLVLAADMGPEGAEVSTPVFEAKGIPVSTWIKPDPDHAGDFQTVGVGRSLTQVGTTQDVELVPFYRLHNRTYSAYFDLYSSDEWKVQAEKIAATQEKQRRLESATVAFAQPGQMQPERDFNQQGEETEPARVQGRAGRRAKKWFSFDVPIDSAHPLKLVLTYNSEEWQTRTFDVLIDDQKVSSQLVTRQLPGTFYDAAIDIPQSLVAGKRKVTVRFQATGGNEVAAIFGIRMIRADANL